MRDDTNDDCDELRALPPPEYSRLFLVCETVVTVLVKVLTVAAVAGSLFILCFIPTGCPARAGPSRISSAASTRPPS